MAKPLNF